MATPRLLPVNPPMSKYQLQKESERLQRVKAAEEAKAKMAAQTIFRHSLKIHSRQSVIEQARREVAANQLPKRKSLLVKPPIQVSRLFSDEAKAQPRVELPKIVSAIRIV